MAKGYIILEIEITDPERYAEYRSAAGPILAAFEGRMLVRNGRSETLEGGWAPASLFVLEFDSFERARAFYFSEAYKSALETRLASSTSKGLLIEGA